MSPRRNVLQFVGILAALALLGALVAGPASAKRMTPKQKAHVRAQLRKQIKKNPKAFYKASFIKKARLVDFRLPVTIRVRRALDKFGAPANNAAGLNTATLDLGPSLGTRTLGLGGKLPAEIEFADSFDGGGLGNVKLNLDPGGAAQGFGLKTTSISLLTNGDTTTQNHDDNLADANLGNGTGCNNWVQFGGAGVDDPSSLTPSFNDGNNNLGAGPFSPEPGATAGTSVLRTDGLNLTVAGSGTPITLPGGSQITTGKSGGTANLFGNIPGKTTQIDVTATLATRINSILREVNASANGQTPLTLSPGGDGTVGTGDDTASGNDFVAFNCRQAITGGVDNYLADIRLNGSLKVAPAITADGKLRIAKANLSLAEPARIAVAACLMPYTSYAAFNPGFDPTAPESQPFVAGSGTIGVPFSGTPNPAASPVNPGAAKPIATGSTYTLPASYGGGSIANAYDASCGSIDPVLTSFGVDPLTNAFGPSPGPGPFTTSEDGSQAKVEANLTTLSLDVDVLVGQI